ncbi:MAG: fructose-1,6-bisphosphate aldolase/phosphatase [Clostridia bacterium]
MGDSVTLSVIKADVGGLVGHTVVHPKLIERAQEELAKTELLEDYHVTAVGDDLNLILTHRRGTDDSEIHGLAWRVFEAATEEAQALKLYGAGQDLLSDAFSGNIKGMGPGVAEMEFEERSSEPVLIFMADKTEPGAWNLPLYRIFADPFNTPGLVIDPNMHHGFIFEVHDLKEGKRILFSCPEDIHDMLVFIGAPGRYVVHSVHRRDEDGKPGDIASRASTQRLNLIAGRYVGKDDPVLMVRCQSGLPAVGEVLEAFAYPHLVAGWMRGSHHGPLMPTGVADATPSRFDGPPRAMCLGFQLADGKLVGPQDMFADIAFDPARDEANRIAGYLRRMGPFEPHRLPLDEMEYTTLPQVAKRLDDRWESMDD